MKYIYLKTQPIERVENLKDEIDKLNGNNNVVDLVQGGTEPHFGFTCIVGWYLKVTEHQSATRLTQRVEDLLIGQHVLFDPPEHQARP